MKKSFHFIITAMAAALVLAFSAFVFVGCSEEKPTEFVLAEYTVADGDFVTVKNPDAEYRLIGDVPSGVEITKGGKFIISGDVPDCTQVTIAAVIAGRITSTAVCKLSVPTDAPVITFGGMSGYVVSGSRISATAEPLCGLLYSLKDDADGVIINPVTGLIRFTSAVEDDVPFTVVATGRGASQTKEYRTAVGNLVTAHDPEAIVEQGVGAELEITLDFGDGTGSSALFREIGVVGAEIAKTQLTADEYSYDKATCTVTVAKSVTEKLAQGENELLLYTAKNAVSVNVRAAKYVRTAEELVAIGKTREALGGYYVLANDIDLSDYLKSKTESGEKGGWYPIGNYRDVTDGTATADAFRGTFDGLGHKITGLWMDWFAVRESGANYDSYFNAGLFGYVTRDGVIRNVEVHSEIDEKSYMCSYSGGLVGVNCGTIENCIANITVVMEFEHRVAGGFVGRNEGTIRNCISLGWVGAAQTYGAFCGTDMGDIIDCYAVDDRSLAIEASVHADRPEILPFCGSGRGENCAVFDSAASLAEGADFSEWKGFTQQDGELPRIKITQTR